MEIQDRLGIYIFRVLRSILGGESLGICEDFFAFALNVSSPEKKKKSSDIIFSTRFLGVNFSSPETFTLGIYKFSKSAHK